MNETLHPLTLIRMDPVVAEAVRNMDLTTVRWEAQGTRQITFRMMLTGDVNPDPPWLRMRKAELDEEFMHDLFNRMAKGE